MPTGHCGRIYLATKGCLSLEIIHSCGTDWGYINTYALGFTDETPTISMTISGQPYEFQGFRLEGYQRVLMPPDATQLLITALLDGFPIHLKASNYQIVLEPLNFAYNYTKLVKK